MNVLVNLTTVTLVLVVLSCLHVNIHQAFAGSTFLSTANVILRLYSDASVNTSVPSSLVTKSCQKIAAKLTAL